MSRFAIALVVLSILLLAPDATAQERGQSPRVMYTLTLEQPQTQIAPGATSS
jgi:hypothetical protein